MSFAKRDMRSPSYLALNPEGKVPTLVIDGRPLTEVAAILFYLARTYPDAQLLPDDAEGQAQAISWMSFIASTLHPARARGLDQTNRVYGIADRKLAGKDWAVGRYSVADIHLFRLYWRFFARGRTGARRVPQPRRASRPHDEASRGAEDMRDRGSDRLRTARLVPGCGQDKRLSITRAAICSSMPASF
jgi:glutathione S-transferase